MLFREKKVYSVFLLEKACNFNLFTPEVILHLWQFRNMKQ
jgi:hypothetical protein